MGISFKNIQSHSLGVGKLEVTDETIRQPYSSCLPSARRSWDWIHLPRSWSWISHKKRFLNKKLLVKISPLTVLRLTSTRHRTSPAAFTSAIVGGKGEVMCIVVKGAEHADQLTLKTDNKVSALRGSTPKRESQQQCSCTINTANHAMLCHTMTYNATPYKLCNAIRCHTIQHHDHDAMQHHTTPFHAMQWHTMQYNAIHCYATPCNTIP